MLVTVKNRMSIGDVLYRIKEVEIILGVLVERRHMSRLLVPVAVVVVRHHVDDVEISVQFRDVVTCRRMRIL